MIVPRQQKQSLAVAPRTALAEDRGSTAAKLQ
jgi:hypothetical protein